MQNEGESVSVRVQTENGFDQVARVEGPAQQHNSYTVASQGKRFIRNKQHLLQVDENPPAISEDDVPPRSTSPVPDGETAQNVNPPPTPASFTPVVNTADSSESQLYQDRPYLLILHLTFNVLRHLMFCGRWPGQIISGCEMISLCDTYNSGF